MNTTTNLPEEVHDLYIIYPAEIKGFFLSILLFFIEILYFFILIS